MQPSTVLTIVAGALSLGRAPLLEQADFSLLEEERVGLIGRNGTGKSSLLKVLCGSLSLDAGDIHIRDGLRFAYTPQDPCFPSDLTVEQAASIGWEEVHTAISAIEQGQGDLLQLQSKIDACDGWNWQRHVLDVVRQLELEPSQQVSTLSGGGRKKVALAQAFAVRPDVLLLDEPTNHLDLDAILWLEDQLLRFRGCLVVVTHDRSFLNTVATRIVELDRGRLRSYPGNFDAYRSLKDGELAAEASQIARADKLQAREEIWIRQGVEARRTRSQSRISRLEALRAERAERRKSLGNVRLDIDPGLQSGKVVAELEGVSKSFDGRAVVKGLSTTVLRGDRIGLMGPNGAGKTTLIRLMLGEIEADQGTVKRGTKLTVAYFDQLRQALNLDATLEDFVSPGSEWIETGTLRKHVRSYLGDFLFEPDRARARVHTLSGGERNRLLLARLFAQPANVLVLDEPTNDLDIDTLDMLEETLSSYSGTVFMVSHDRTFLNQVVTSTLVAQGSGEWLQFEGNVMDWQTQSQRRRSGTASTERANEDGAKETKVKRPTKSAERQKLSYKEQQELSQLPQRIDDLETEQRSIRAALADGSLFAKDHQRAHVLAQRDQAIEEELLTALERWESLGARN